MKHYIIQLNGVRIVCHSIVLFIDLIQTIKYKSMEKHIFVGTIQESSVYWDNTMVTDES